MEVPRVLIIMPHWSGFKPGFLNCPNLGSLRVGLNSLFLASILWASSIALSSLSGSRIFNFAIISAFNLLMNVDSNTWYERLSKDDANCSNLYLYSLTDPSCLIDKNSSYIDDSGDGRNRQIICERISAQLRNCRLLFSYLNQTSASPSKLIMVVLSFSTFVILCRAK